MSEPAIKIEGVSKRYRIGARLAPYRTLREAVVDIAAAPLRRLRSFGRASHRDEDTFWALKDVSFEVQAGEVVGLIGPNGAGKTTLLRVLSRITEPTEGRAEIRGRVGSLLEVGTGFHPELTGRENVYLSGAILGMSRREIRSRFDAIVDFSGVEQFLDTPVKHYSSGMLVRLGFAVAAHLDPEVLLVDEVLAVGDAAFQKKCLGKMDEVARGGRTVVLVSHNMTAIQNFSRRVLVLRDGRIFFAGDVHKGVEVYLREHRGLSETMIADRTDRSGGSDFRFLDFELLDAEGNRVSKVPTGAHVRIRLVYRCSRAIAHVNPGLALFRADGTRIASLSGSLLGKVFDCQEGAGSFVFDIPRLPLNAGRYLVLVDAKNHTVTLDRLEAAFAIDVWGGAFYPGGSSLPDASNTFLVDFDVAAGER